MTRTKHSGPRPLNVFVAPRSKAEQATRNLAANAVVSPKAPPPQAEAAAPGFRPHPELDLHDQGGKIIKDLIFTNLYVGGANSWDPVDIKSIDTNLAAAMSDKRLNNVLLQYFRGAATITSTFRPSTTLPGPAPNQFSMGDVEALVRNLRAGNQLSSLEGLGGFHGSVLIGDEPLYYAIGVFSEGGNGITSFDKPWKNVVAKFYHELVEARTDADVETNNVAWVNNERPSEEIGDIPMTLAGVNLKKVMVEVPLANGQGMVPIQLMWSNAVHAPEGPIEAPHPPTH